MSYIRNLLSTGEKTVDKDLRDFNMRFKVHFYGPRVVNLLGLNMKV